MSSEKTLGVRRHAAAFDQGRHVAPIQRGVMPPRSKFLTREVSYRLPMSYREPLPENCPPAESEEIAAERIVFRIVQTNPATLDDFRSQRELRPNASFPGVSECRARGVSVHADRADSEKLRKLPRFQSSLVCKVRLEGGAGRIQQTGKPSHHTWWPLAAFDILDNCEVLA